MPLRVSRRGISFVLLLFLRCVIVQVENII